MKTTLLALLLIALPPLSAAPSLPPGPVIGIGTEVQATDHHLVVANVVPSSPADKQGIKTGDRFLRINGVKVEGLTLLEVASRLRGDVGSPISVTVLRHGSERTFDMRRQVILMPGSRMPGQ